jgi:lysophospholipase L1-like esterase
MKRILARLGVSAITAILAISAAEIVLRAALPEANHWFVWPPRLHARFEIAPDLLPGAGREVRLQVNSLGFRGSEIPRDAARRVLALGGSTTECLYLDQDKTWPALLEKTLNERDADHPTWIGNAGRSGCTLRENVVQLEELVRAIPNLDVVLVLPGINDLSKRLAQGDAYDPDLSSSESGREAVMRRAFGVHPLEVDAELPIYERTGLWRFASAIRRRFESGDPNRFGAGAEQYRAWRDHRRSATRWIGVLPDLTKALDEYRRNLEELVDIAQRAHVRILLATQPILWRIDLPQGSRDLLWMGGTGDFQREEGKAYFTLPALIEGMKRYNDVTRGVARERDLEWLDLAELIDGEPALFYDDCHFTEAGARRVASGWAGLLAAKRTARR